ncbi:hypothetical protein AWH56_000040 [Anaerobacillus isosaccharinicus]|uniref:Uncharacterized protein n=1 Tax=Anaerobacillus isosaccharinicus TaxID=1532552 RepID=A0A1S2LQZ2_9BACI|nr:hypothetical protein [Anaerobacillus isosaccharinicus]MBA5585557.1 hypothetical protein [Anaerobacillus isosaccharinicus]QOY36130.1 hypothetical protein AWH56_000040 [Anaerobacillus isosaccharinicus]
MKKLLVGTVIIAFLTGSLLYYFTTLKETVQETIANYPIDEKKKFKQVKTTLQLIDQHDEDEYTMEWKTSSEINEKMYIAHDISLLFEDGRLKETLSQTKENSQKLTQTAKISGEDSGHFETITFHYGQFHYPNDVTKSVQSMSYDQMYILDSPLSPIEFFKSPQTPSEKEGKRVLDTIINQNLQYTWEELIDYFQVKAENYHSVPLTNLYEYNNTSLPNLTIEDTKEMIALTWSSIYKYYFLGIEKHDGTILSPVGSSIPLILYHNTYSHIIIVFTNKDGEKYSVIKNTGRF